MFLRIFCAYEKSRNMFNHALSCIHDFEYIMSTLGYSAGFGSIWRFPYLSKYKIKVYTHGGGAFLIPYLICFLTISIPLFYFETSLG